MEKEGNRIRELWERQQRAEGPGTDATPKEQQYYKLIEQVEMADRDAQKIPEVEITGRYRCRLVSSYSILKFLVLDRWHEAG
jgi:hypothetical protein